MACCVLTAAAIALVLAIKARLIGRPSDDVLAWRLRRMNDDRTEMTLRSGRLESARMRSRSRTGCRASAMPRPASVSCFGTSTTPGFTWRSAWRFA